MIYEFWFNGISITCDKCVKSETYLHLSSNGSFVAMIDLSLYSVVFYDKVNDYIVFRLEKIEQYDEQQEFYEAMEHEEYLNEVDEINSISDEQVVFVNRDDIVSNEELEEIIQSEKNNKISDDELKLSDIHNFSISLYGEDIICDNIHYYESFIGTGYIEFLKDNIVIDTFMVCNYHLRFITILENTAYYNLVYKGA